MPPSRPRPASQRCRDPLASLPLLARPPPPCAKASRRATQRVRAGWRRDRVVRSLVSGLQELAGCEPSEKGTLGVGDWGEVERLRVLADEHTARVARGSESWSGSPAAAFWRLSGRPTAYGASDTPVRGDVVPARVDCIDLPSASSKFDAKLAWPQLDDWKGWMMRDPPPPAEELAAVRTYADPELRPGSPGLVRLAWRMFKAGMLRPVRRRGDAGIDMFTVVKREGHQRLVFDMRRANLAFKVPPRCTMGSVQALASLELGPSETTDAEGRPRVPCAFAGDVPDFFYGLLLTDLAEYLWLAGLDIGDFVAYARAQEPGLDLASFDGCDGLGMTSPPMGWSWAPLLAQGCLEHVMNDAGIGRETQLRHGEPPPEIGATERAALGYLDDFLGIVLGYDEADAEARAADGLSRMREALRRANLGCHKEQLGRFLVELGMELDLDRGTLAPDAGRLRRLLDATRYACTRRTITPYQLAVLAGHWAWLFLLRRELYCVFNAIYLVIDLGRAEPHTPLAMPADVRRELQWAVQLAPCLRADLRAEWDSEVICTDASEWGGGICVASCPVEVVRATARRACSWSGATDPELCCPVLECAEWRVAASFPWRDEQHINTLEARVGALGVQRALRTRARRGRRLLSLIDSQVALGAFRKGRSSKPGLLGQCRRVAAWALFGELRVTWAWIPTGRNPADAPSRNGQGAAPGAEWSARAGSRGRAPRRACSWQRPGECRTSPTSRRTPRGPHSCGTTAVPSPAPRCSSSAPKDDARGCYSSRTMDKPGPLVRSCILPSGASRGCALSPTPLSAVGGAPAPSASRPCVLPPRRPIPPAPPRPAWPGPDQSRGASTPPRESLGCGMPFRDTQVVGRGPARAAATGTRSSPWTLDAPGVPPSPVEAGSLADLAIGESTREIYFRVLGRFQTFLRSRPFRDGLLPDHATAGLPQGDWASELDSSLYAHLHAVRRREGGVAEAGQVLSAVKHAYPNLGDTGLPLSFRALKGFGRVAPAGQREAVTWGTAGVLACAMRHGGPPPGSEGAATAELALATWPQVKRWEGALITLLAFDCCLRDQDWARLQWSDIACDGQDTALLFGQRGERTKTGGLGEGVVVLSPLVRALLLTHAGGAEGLRQRTQAGGRVFSLAVKDLRAMLRDAAHDMKMTPDGRAPKLVPHVLRHGGATHLSQVRHWGAKDIALRGRWRSLESVRRYARPHALVKAKADLPPHFLRCASDFERDPRRAWNAAAC